MAGAGDTVSVRFKLYALTVMTINAAGYILLLRYTRTVDGPMYFSTTTVVMTEVFKLLSSICMLFSMHRSLSATVTDIYRNVFCNPMDSFKMCIPSIIYMVQNNLAFVALSNLDAGTYQVTYQLKIISTALFSVILLRKQISVIQWISLVTLFAGVACVQLQPDSFTKKVEHVNYTVGLISILSACLCSGFAGVYFEKVLKGSDTSLWIRNIQMYLFGIVSGLIGVYTKDFFGVIEKGFFYGYTPYVWAIVVAGSVGGLYTSVVVKYTDNIIKGFSTTISIILSTLMSVYLFGKEITVLFSLGAGLVILAIFLYGMPARKPPPSASDSKASGKLAQTV
ncbi:CMP-sialic acid transporter-like [Saccoglossus kowalevskii]|uniref:CMP-sialic acid transporter-like n=1 Tax=Saccoglossus kowalevskii TaxID=10224 RepID=A0ABM0MP80_SACKO|nr:PREDICTED: CMP-sialic acid transporter-like [Saccoglossus kowalevskii]